MKLPNWFKIIWWILLLGIVTYFMSQRYNSLANGSATQMDIFIFLIWISLLLVPLFQEVSFFGIKLKKEIDSLKSDVKEQIVNLRSYIQNTIQFNPQIYLTPPSSDSQLNIIEENVRPILNEIMRKHGVQVPDTISSKMEIPDNTRFLFSIRYEIDKEVKRIWQYSAAKEGKRPLPILQIIRSLTEFEIINPKLANVIREVYKICSFAIHGEHVTDGQINFVRDLAPQLIVSLKAIH